ncbi:MAG: N-acetyl-alpha-D-glucosaminyl L-malate synthase BshA [Bacteroidota bacterium]|jgi:N-acetyl-alpha-D-glucosaminyl L-malate synthase BshA
MKIGIVCYPTFGGSGVVATELGLALAAEGHQVHFISYSQPARLEYFSENVFYHEVSVSNYPLFEYQPYELALTSKLVDVVKYEKLDLLHVHYAIPHASAAFMARSILLAQGLYIPFITTLHGTDITLLGKDPSFEPVITYTINQSDAVTAVSESLKQDTYKYFPITREIQVIPNFISLADYDRINREGKSYCHRKTYAPSGEKILLHMSNFRKVKRLDDVIQIFFRVQHEVPSKLLLVGDGPERNRIEQLCRDMGIFGNVKFLGKITAPEQILSLADLFLLPSETESFGLAALEAMASSVPVISTNTGGLPEVNKNGVSGFTAHVGDVDEMASKALLLLKNPEMLRTFKEQARKAASAFDISVVLPAYESLYNNLIVKSV